ncbi:MAG TPA: S8 family serine peptidase [Jatrophihabitantaceae bacterium]|jgi:serine protease AprX|nr:S8 family serine peptidase [Jatrophihabitantaceae bacterium]
MSTPRIAPSRRTSAAVAALTLAAGVVTLVPATAASAHPARTNAVDRGSFNSSHWGDPLADLLSSSSGGKYTAKKDPGSLYTIENAIGARDVWQQTDAQHRQITGQGVTVALLDSGTAAVAGLTGPNKLTYGPDLSIESNGVLTDQDTYGHGTHLAGIIAAHDGGALTSKTIKQLDPDTELGVAPDAELESIKLATTDGSADVSQVIAALNWITEHQTAADGSQVRVVNLSFGTDSVQPYQLDPLAAAAENAWKHGLVVVVSAGNEGPSAPVLDDPAIDPYVIAVGASDSDDSISGWNHPDVASFSSGGSLARHVDLVAPGTSITSLRDPGSFVDQNHPEGQVDGDTAARLFRGSGTSQAAAVVSGSVALLLQAYPNLTPDQVKGLLMAGASSVSGSSRYSGAGELDIDATLSAARNFVSGPGLLGTILNALTGNSAPNYTQTFPASTGLGSLQAARGSDQLVDADGNPFVGEVDIQGNPWNAAAWWAAASSGTSWSGGNWMGVPWTGAGWDPTGDGTQSARWSSARWSSARWSDADWDSARWSSARWSSARWSSARWSSARWSDEAWQ